MSVDPRAGITARGGRKKGAQPSSISEKSQLEAIRRSRKTTNLTDLGKSSTTSKTSPVPDKSRTPTTAKTALSQGRQSSATNLKQPAKAPQKLQVASQSASSLIAEDKVKKKFGKQFAPEACLELLTVSNFSDAKDKRTSQLSKSVSSNIISPQSGIQKASSSGNTKRGSPVRKKYSSNQTGIEGRSGAETEGSANEEERAHDKKPAKRGQGDKGGSGGSSASSEIDEESEDPLIDRQILLREPISVPSSEKSWGEVTLLTAYSEPPYIYIRKARRLNRDRNKYGHDALYLPTKLLVDGEQVEGKRIALMLFPGQGGTFGFGYAFKDEKQKNVIINGDRSLAQVSESKTKHLLFYRAGTELIGTSMCITCVGVYFEIKGHRCFCAHINTWHLGNKRAGPGPKVPMLSSDDEIYDEIWQAIRSRLEKHSREYGWTTDGEHGENDYVPGTLKLVCPYPQFVGHAVISSIAAFLRLDELGESPNFEEMKAQGFAILPGAYESDRKPQGVLESFIAEGKDPVTGEDVDIWERMPSEIEKYELRVGEDARYRLQPWTYQAGTALRNERWSWNEWNGMRIHNFKDTPPVSVNASQTSLSSNQSSDQQSSNQSQGLVMRRRERPARSSPLHQA